LFQIRGAEKRKARDPNDRLCRGIIMYAVKPHFDNLRATFLIISNYGKGTVDEGKDSTRGATGAFVP